MSEQTPIIWSEFTNVRYGKELKFRIEELPKERHMEFLEFFFEQFSPEETLHKASGVTKNEASFNEYKQLMTSSLERGNVHMDVCYLVEDTGLTMAGGSFMILDKKGDPSIDFGQLAEIMETEEMKKLLIGGKFLADSCNEKEKYNLDSYFEDRGISVHRDYRKLGIAGELFKARVLICKHYKVPMTGAWMSSYGTQKAAAKLGWETICEIPYNEMAKATGLTFAGSPPSCKLMVIRAIPL